MPSARTCQSNEMLHALCLRRMGVAALGALLRGAVKARTCGLRALSLSVTLRNGEETCT
jgi:hypothetical protein